MINNDWSLTICFVDVNKSDRVKKKKKKKRKIIFI